MTVEDRVRAATSTYVERIEPVADGWLRLAEQAPGRPRHPWLIAVGAFLLVLVVIAGFASTRWAEAKVAMT